jgi:hypothetical protein
MPKTERSRRPVPRPEADESTTRAATPIMRPRMRPDNIEDLVERRIMEEEGGAVERGNRASMREAEDYEDFVERKEYRDGGMVRGCKPAQMSGKGFKGTF